MSRSQRKISHGFSITEVLVTITVIGILLSLLLISVQAARESARRLHCLNNVKQQAMAMLLHESAYRQLPSGGWGFRWVGDPSRGVQKEQPGGWIFNILPYVDQSSLYQLGAGQSSTNEQRSQLAMMISQPLPLFHCPSRRTARGYPSQWQPFNADFAELVAKTDYAANAGSVFLDVGTGPISLEQGDADSYQWPSHAADGVCYLRSKIKIKEILDGTSHTLLLGEKNIPRANYFTGDDRGDDQSMYSGDDFDTLRWANPALPPIHDATGFLAEGRFGSAHSSGLNMAFCDGSVRHLNYTIDRFAFADLGNRHDGNVVEAPATGFMAVAGANSP